MVTRLSSRAASASSIGCTSLAVMARMKGARSLTCMADSSAMFFPFTLLPSAAWLRRAPWQAGQSLRVKILSYSARTCGCKVSGSFAPMPFFSLTTTPS